MKSRRKLRRDFSFEVEVCVLTKRFWDDRDGAVLPYVAIMLVVIFGLAALAIDASRLMSVQTQLQGAADALALAGATELDRRPDSIIRAEAAIHNLIANPVSGTGSAKQAEIAHIDYLRSLPRDDDLPLTDANLTDDPTQAAYVRVAVKPVELSMTFPMPSLRGHGLTIGAEATAGYDQIVCNAAPVFVCNPYETAGMSYYQATQALIAADHGTHSQLVRLAHSQFKGGGFAAGDFGYLAPATGYLPENSCGPVGTGIPQALAATQVQACFRLSGVHAIANDDTSAMDGLNTRFDLYSGEFRTCHGYPPDLNVRKGFTAFYNTDWCNNATPASSQWPMPVAAAAALPVDQNMIAGAQSFEPNVTLGSGIWNCANYWSTAHYAGQGKDAPPAGCSAVATISRYDVYRYELNFPNDRSVGTEVGAPQCVREGVANRRVLTTAIVNCGSSPVPAVAGLQGIPVAAFGRFFLTLPAEAGTNENPYAEFMGLVPRTDPNSSDLVQLYR